MGRGEERFTMVDFDFHRGVRSLYFELRGGFKVGRGDGRASRTP